MVEKPEGRESEAETESKETSSEDIKKLNEEHQLKFWKLFWWCWGVGQKALIWGVFFALLYALRHFFPLIFLTFVFSFVAATLARALSQRAQNLSWKANVTIVYAGFALIWTIIALLLVPDIRSGASDVRDLVRDFPDKWTKTIEQNLKEEHEWYVNLLRYLDAPAKPEKGQEGVEDEEAKTKTGEATAAKTDPPPPVPEKTVEDLRLFETAEVKNKIKLLEGWLFEHAPGVITGTVALALGIASLLFLSVLFSFLIVIDLDTLKNEVAKLERTKLHGFYKETGKNIVQFGNVLGNVLEAQALISLVNTILTAIGLKLFFELDYVAFLALVVFICGFIPVAGVFISSVPICLVALNDPKDGLFKCLMIIVFITAIHFVEAYLLNPRIMGAKLKVNPVLVLAILVIGHHAGGVWGLLLGLPFCFYFFKHVIKREPAEIGFWGKRASAG